MAGRAQSLRAAVDAVLDETSDWEHAARDWPTSAPSSLLRAYSDEVNARLVRRWLPSLAGSRVLKTDLFDEAVAAGLVPGLRAAGASVVGVDVSEATVAAARMRYPDLEVEIADVRRLPFADASFDVVVSNSTLDHFESITDLRRAIGELHRVLGPGGNLLITLDNGANPLVALRNALPARALRRLGLTHYVLGTTCGPRRLSTLLQTAGFEIERASAVMHFPRVAARLLAAAVGPRARLLRLLVAGERLERTPLRYATGQFVAAQAVKPLPPP